jgi:psp operon transcriptional activator
MVDIPTPLGQSPAFLAHVDHLSRVAPLDRPVLLIGERGTGKELSAARVHYLSPRWSGPLVKLNCAALPETLLEAELFGVEPGAYTGANRQRAGRFELADGGTLLLDEIGNAPLSVQEKILRVIEYGELERLGGAETLRVSVRVVAATNVDLPQAARQGKFRDDLLDRLAFDVLTLPPLRARAGDVSLLAEHFARAMAAELGWRMFPGFTGAVAAKLEGHRWPGNVRELKNVAERAVAHWSSPDTPIDAVILDPFASPHRPAAAAIAAAVPEAASPARAEPLLTNDYRAAVRSLGREILAGALANNRHNQRAAAASLGLTYHQFRNLLKTHGLRDAGSRTSAPE